MPISARGWSICEPVAVAKQAMRQRSGELMATTPHPGLSDKVLIELVVPDAAPRDRAALLSRGLSREMAVVAAEQMMSNDALGAHARDELGISEITTARPLQAALASALTFTACAAAPLLAIMLTPPSLLVAAVAIVSLACLAALGALGALAGGAPVSRSLLRVMFWGASAMALTASVGRLSGTTVG